MTEKKLRVGIVGGGFGQAVLLPAFRSISQCEVVGIVASTEEKSKTMAEKNNLKHVFRNWNDLLDNGQLDIVAIATPPHVQVPVIKSALGKKLSVFAEKPLALHFEDAQSISNTFSKTTNQRFAYDVEFMEIPKWQKTKSLLSSGEIGTIKRVFVNWTLMTFANLNQLSSWKTSTEQGGGALSAFGTHVFYYLEEFVGPIEKMNVVLSRDPSDTRDTDTFLQLNCKFKSGAEGHVVIHTNKLGGAEHSIEFIGDKGQILLVNNTSDYMKGFQIYKCESGKDAVYSQLEGDSESPSEFADGRIDAVRSLIARWLASKDSFNPGINHAVRNQLLVNLAMKSHRTQRWVHVVENGNG